MKSRTLLGLVAWNVPCGRQAITTCEAGLLDECLQQASFRNNLEIQIIRFRAGTGGTQSHLRELRGLRSNFSVSYGADKNTQPSQTGVGQVPIPGNISWSRDGGLDFRDCCRPEPITTSTRNPAVPTQFHPGNHQLPSHRAGQCRCLVDAPPPQDMWIDSTRWSISLNKKTLLQQEQSIRTQLSRPLRTFQLAYYDLAAAAVKGVEVQKQAVELAERLLMENRKRVEVGALARWRKTGRGTGGPKSG